MFDAIPTSVWLAVTTTNSVLFFLALWLYLWHSNLVGRHNQYIGDVAELETRKVQLEAEIKQQYQWLDENKETLLGIERQRQKYAQLKDKLEEMHAVHTKEEEILANVRKKSVTLKSVVTSLTRERERMQDQVDALNNRIEEAKLCVAEAEKMKMMAALRTNMALMDLKTRRNELQELTALYDKEKYTGQLSNDFESDTLANTEKGVSYGDSDSSQADVSSEIHINVI